MSILDFFRKPKPDYETSKPQPIDRRVEQKPREVEGDAITKIGYAGNRINELLGQIAHEGNAYAIGRANDALNDMMIYAAAAARIKKPTRGMIQMPVAPRPPEPPKPEQPAVS